MWKALSLVLGLMLTAAMTYAALDYPHTDRNNLICTTCHDPHGGLAALLPSWTDDDPPLNIDDTPANRLCWSCHNDIEAPYVRTHSSLTTDNDYGDWSIECRTCHDPHLQRQFWNYGGEDYQVDSGTSTAIDATTLSDTAAAWTPDAYKGYVVVPNLNEKQYNYKILSNDNTTLTVEGPMDLSKVAVGDTYAIIYGKLIKSTIATPESGEKAVRFFRDLGWHAYADGDAVYDGVCEVCHTQTTHHRNDAGGDHTHNVGLKCTTCHQHVNGFRGMGGGAHPTHITKSFGPELDCVDCHGSNTPPVLADGQNLTTTTVCDTCHSADGVANARAYWSTAGSSEGAAGSWLVVEGVASFCGSCHDETPGNTRGDGSGEAAPNVLGDNATYGYYVTGHGKATGTYAKLSWQDSSATGNPAANKACSDCHDLTSQHFYGTTKRLKAGYENDQNNTNCNKCHISGIADADPQFYTTSAVFEASAHGDNSIINPLTANPMLCSDCHDVHGAAGSFAGMTRGDRQSLCYQCHTDGMVNNFGIAGYTGSHDGGDNQPGLTDSTANWPTLNVTLVNWKVYNLTDGSSGTITSHDATQITATLSGGAENDWDDGDKYHIALVDDIQQAFGMSETHNLGTSFELNSKNYTLECVSCHNVHIVTGKHWDVAQALSPVTRFTNNTSVWGDEPGEKMDDFAASGSGTGGWYYKTAQGNPLGATNLAFDQPAVYRPPKASKGYGWEFGGDVLPDYATFCLDCHTYRMSAANPPINWGQGISCTDNAVDPPDQRIECGADHGLGPAGKPYYISDSGTAGNWGTSGNPDPVFHMNYVTRGRHNGHFMRWPYDSAERSAGINFVMSCTDCHEAHGANAPSMLRPAVNNYGPGTSNWNTFCNNCHYYYGGQHSGMSCGNASCHEANSIHRIIHTGDSGAGTQLMLTAAGYESNYQRPTFTPEIQTVAGHIGSDELTVTFTEGVYTLMDLSGALEPGDFLLTDVGGNNPRSITGVTHTAGETVATITMDAPLVAADLDNDLLATRGKSVWNWNETGYNDQAGNWVDPAAVPAGPWPVTITGPPPVGITTVEGIIGYDRLYVGFSEPVYANIDGTGDLDTGDFTLTDNDNGRTIDSMTHTAGESTAVLILSLPLDDTDDIDVDTLAAASAAIHDAYGNAAATDPVTITAVVDAPSISAVQGAEGHAKLAVWFSERVYANSDATGALQPGDFVFTDAGAGKNITAVDHTPGAVTATLTLDGSIESADIGSATLAAAGGSIYDITGYPAHSNEAVILTAGNVSSISQVEGVEGSAKLKVTFQSQVYANDDETGALDANDFSLDASGKGILGVQHTAGDSIAIITMDGGLTAGDIDTSTLAAASNAIFGPSAGNFPLGTDPVTITAQTAPAMTRVEGAVGYNQLFVSFSEGVYTGAGQSGALVASDFSYNDVYSGGATSIIGVTHTAGHSTAIITLDATLDANDVDTDTLAAAGSEIYNSIDNPVGTTAVAITANDCPAWGTSFPIEDVPQASATIQDEYGLLTGTVGNPGFAFPDPSDNDWFTGDEDQGTYIDMTDNSACLSSARALTIEALVKPTEVDRGVGDNTFNRIFERRRNLLVTILNTDYRGDDIPGRANKASIEVKYRVDAASRHTCPHPQWPADPYIGNDVKMHQISSDIDQWPMVNDHWYQIKVVFNSDKSDVGSNGTPVDIFIDDRGTDGLNNPNPTPGDPASNPDYEQWPDYVNATRTINQSSSCKWGALPGDFIELRSDTSHIGSSWSHAQPFEGQIDWVTWKPVADYSGVDDPPN